MPLARPSSDNAEVRKPDFPVEDAREFHFSDRDFEFIRQLVGERTGIVLGENKRELVYGRLARRLRQLGVATFAEYCDFVQARPDTEVHEIINAITTNLTSFFREAHHFQYLAGEVLPRLLERNAAKRRLRIWSAGCSTGEEPYSIAVTLAESLPHIGGWDVRILATDVDSNVLATAERGIYALERVSGLEAERRRRWFRRGTGAQAGQAKISDEVKRLIAFRHLNLMEAWPMRGPFDAIFCRNVVIYFDKPTQARLFNRFAGILDPEGYLFVGHSETLLGVSDAFELVGRTVYRRRP
jgi:chemotaxis protein methyltransferase CheR